MVGTSLTRLCPPCALVTGGDIKGNDHEPSYSGGIRLYLRR